MQKSLKAKNSSKQLQTPHRRWNFYRLNYMLSAKLPTYFNVTVDIVMIDTIQLCGRLPDTGRVTPQGPDDEDEAQKTWSWIEGKLRSST